MSTKIYTLTCIVAILCASGLAAIAMTEMKAGVFGWLLGAGEAISVAALMVHDAQHRVDLNEDDCLVK